MLLSPELHKKTKQRFVLGISALLLFLAVLAPVYIWALRGAALLSYVLAAAAAAGLYLLYLWLAAPHAALLRLYRELARGLVTKQQLRLVSEEAPVLYEGIAAKAFYAENEDGEKKLYYCPLAYWQAVQPALLAGGQASVFSRWIIGLL